MGADPHTVALRPPMGDRIGACKPQQTDNKNRKGSIEVGTLALHTKTAEGTSERVKPCLQNTSQHIALVLVRSIRVPILTYPVSDGLGPKIAHNCRLISCLYAKLLAGK